MDCITLEPITLKTCSSGAPAQMLPADSCQTSVVGAHLPQQRRCSTGLHRRALARHARLHSPAAAGLAGWVWRTCSLHLLAGEDWVGVPRSAPPCLGKLSGDGAAQPGKLGAVHGVSLRRVDRSGVQPAEAQCSTYPGRAGAGRSLGPLAQALRFPACMCTQQAKAVRVCCPGAGGPVDLPLLRSHARCLLFTARRHSISGCAGAGQAGSAGAAPWR